MPPKVVRRKKRFRRDKRRPRVREELVDAYQAGVLRAECEERDALHRLAMRYSEHGRPFYAPLMVS